MDVKDILKNQWKESVCNYDWWVSAGKRNFFIAESLCEKYLTANKNSEIKINEFRGSEITKDEQEWSLIHKEVLMFYGFATECYLKGLLAKEKTIDVLDDKKEFTLNEKFTRHISPDFYKSYKNIFPKIDQGAEKHIKYLYRAVISGKYPFEKTPEEKFAYTGDFDNTVLFAKSLISSIEKLLQ